MLLLKFLPKYISFVKNYCPKYISFVNCSGKYLYSRSLSVGDRDQHAPNSWESSSIVLCQCLFEELLTVYQSNIHECYEVYAAKWFYHAPNSQYVQMDFWLLCEKYTECQIQWTGSIYEKKFISFLIVMFKGFISHANWDANITILRNYFIIFYLDVWCDDGWWEVSKVLNFVSLCCRCCVYILSIV